jgi:hypothetical protein
MAHNVILVDRTGSIGESNAYYLYDGVNKTRIYNYASYGKQYYSTCESRHNYMSNSSFFEYKFYNENNEVIFTTTVLNSYDVSVIHTLDNNAGFIIRVNEYNATTNSYTYSYHRVSK